jgi:hypothetical protein
MIAVERRGGGQRRLRERGEEKECRMRLIYF